MKNFQQQTIHIPHEHYVPDAISGSVKDTFLLRLLKGMKVQEQENVNLKNQVIKKSTQPSAITTITFSNDLMNEIKAKAFAQKMNDSDFINHCLDLGVSPQAENLSAEEITQIRNQMEQINEMIKPYIQKDLAKLNFAIQMEMNSQYPKD